MADYTIGTAYLQIVPSFRDTVVQITQNAAEWGRTGGQAFSDSFNATVNRGTSGLNLGPSRASSTKQGTDAAGAFGDAFRARMDAAMRALPSARLTMDDSQASATLDRVRARMAALSDARIGIDISDTKALAEIELIKADLASIGRSSESITVKVDTNLALRTLMAFGKDVEGAVGDVETGVKGIGSLFTGAIAGVKSWFSSVSEGGQTASLSFLKMGASAVSSMASVGAMTVAVISAASALTTIAAVGVPGLVGIAGAALAAGAGIGAFALAAAPALDSVKKQAADLLSTFQDENRAAVLPALQAAVSALGPAFRLLTPLVQTSSSALTDMGRSVKAALGSSEWQSFSILIAGQANTGLKAFGSLLGGVANAARGLLTQFAPFTSDVIQWTGALGGFLDKWSKGLPTNSGLQSFFAYVRANGPVVAGFFRSFGTDAGLLLDTFAKLGPEVLTVASGFLKLASFPLTAFAGVATGISKVAQAIGLVPKQASTAANALGNSLIQMAAAAANPEKEFNKLALDVDALRQKNVSLKATLDGQTATMNTQVENARKYGASASQVAQLQDGWNKKIDATKAAINGNNVAIGQIQKAQENLRPQIQAMTIDQNASALAAENATVKGRGFGAALSGVASAAGSAAIGLTMGLSPAQLLAIAHQELTAQEDKLQTAISKVSGAVAALDGGFLSLDEAQNNTSASLQALSGSIQQNGASLDGNTAKGLANRQAVDAVANSIHAQIDTMTKQHASISDIDGMVVGNVAQLDKQLGQMGLNTQQIQAYNYNLGLTPAQVNTALKQSGYSDAINNVNTLNGLIDAIHNKTVSINFDFFAQAGAQIQSAFHFAEGGVIEAATGVVMPKSAARAGMVTRSPTYLVGEDGSGYDEYVVPTNPLYHSQAMRLLTQLHSALGVQKFANGGVISGVGDITYVYGTSALPDLLGLADATVNKAASYVQPVVPNVPGTSAQVAQWIGQALALMGMSSAFAPGIANIIQHESGGNPSAINLTDSNAAAGHPSQGLMQTIPSTFAAYVLPSLRGLGIDNPIANITAGVRYALANYGPAWLMAGGNRSASGAYLGYAEGGILGKLGELPWLANGGVAVSPTIAGVGDTPEAIVPLDRLGQIISGLPGIDMGAIQRAGGLVGNRTGVHVEEAHFHDEADIRGLMNQANFSLVGI